MVVDYGLDVCEIKTAKFITAFRATPEPENIMTVTVFRIFFVNPLAATALEAVEESPLIAVQGF